MNVIDVAWVVCVKAQQGIDTCVIVDAPNATRASLASPYTGLDGQIVHFRRPDLDGLSEDDAHSAVWPCEERPCPGCPCCEEGICVDGPHLATARPPQADPQEAI
jgi:hypothetical protein